MMIQILPRAKYGQFPPANSMVRNIINMFIGSVGAFYLDHIVHNKWRMIFIWQVTWMIVALVMLLYVYRCIRNMRPA